MQWGRAITFVKGSVSARVVPLVCTDSFAPITPNSPISSFEVLDVQGPRLDANMLLASLLPYIGQPYSSWPTVDLEPKEEPMADPTQTVDSIAVELSSVINRITGYNDKNRGELALAVAVMCVGMRIGNSLDLIGNALNRHVDLAEKTWQERDR